MIAYVSFLPWMKREGEKELVMLCPEPRSNNKGEKRIREKKNSLQLHLAFYKLGAKGKFEDIKLGQERSYSFWFNV